MARKLQNAYQTMLAIATLLVCSIFNINPGTVSSARIAHAERAVDGMVLALLRHPFLAALLAAFSWRTASALDSAFQNQYRQEFVIGYEAHSTLLKETVTTEAQIQGNQCIFLVADSGNATAVSRGTNGLIPARADDLNQYTILLQEWHDLVRKTGFNIFGSQGNARTIMQMTSLAVVNRKLDALIINALNTGTITIGAASATPTVSLFQNGRVKLSNAAVPWDSNVCFLCQPSYLAYLEQTPEFTNAQYVDLRPYAGDAPSWRDRPLTYRWRNVLVIEHPNLPGRATASEKSFLFHKAAVGLAIDTAGMKTPVGYNEEQDYSWARASAFMGATVLQNAGIVVFTTDGVAYG